MIPLSKPSYPPYIDEVSAESEVDYVCECLKDALKE